MSTGYLYYNGSNYGVKGGYRNQPSSFSDTPDVSPVFNNTDENVYMEYRGVKAYNSAILITGTNTFSAIFFFPEAVYTIDQSGSVGSKKTYYVNSGRSASNGVGWETCGVYISGISSSLVSDVPIFTDQTEFANYVKNVYVPPVQTYVSNGGGATHIAKRTGQLKDLSSHLSDILIVSGGGGGGMLIGDTAYPGADAGGIAGNSDNSADQTTGYAFGQGENG